MVGGGRPLLPEIWVKLTRWSTIADFQSIFAHSASVVASSKKSSINTTCFPM